MAPPAKRAPAAAAATVPKKQRKPAGGGGKRQPPKARLPEGTLLTDLKKQEWRVGRVIGEGGFGLVYLGSGPTTDCVIKAEPKGNGPLFCEMHFYQRAADGSRVADWAKQRGLKYVGVPRFYGCGHHTGSDGVEHRFLAIERLGQDLERWFDTLRDERGRQPPGIAFDVAMQVLDALEFVHDSGYAHADVKASNLLMSSAESSSRIPGYQVYLADYGLAFRYFADGRWLKEEKEDPKRRHDGTAEYCSRDAHRGLAPTPRADLENLAWCLLAWLTGPLPWQPYRDSSERVQQAKTDAVARLPAFLSGRGFANKADADAVGELLRHADGLGYHERPQYRRLRDLLQRRVVANAGSIISSAATGLASATAALAAALNKSVVAKASPRATGAKPSTVAKVASPRATGAKPSTVAKVASPRATVAKPSTIAKAAASPGASNGDAVDDASSSSTSASRKRKSGFCQTSPHLLKEAKRLARRGRGSGK